MHRGHRYSTVTIAKNETNSGSFQIPENATFVGALFPAMDDGDVTIQISDDGTNYYPVLDPSDGDDLVVCKSGADAGWIDLSDYLRFVQGYMQCRFVSATSQSTAAVTIKIVFTQA